MKKPKLPPETETHYFSIEPVFHHYKTLKVKDFCDCCGHKTGTHDVQKGVKVIGWEVVKHKKDMMYYTMKVFGQRVIDDVLGESTLISKLIKHD